MARTATAPAVEDYTVVYDNKVLYKPMPKQILFHKCPAEVAFYGGAAGGGKSKAILWEGIIEMLEVPGNRGLLLRRTFAELEQTLIPLSLEDIPSALGKYNAGKHFWTFRNGSVLQFGYCDAENDVYRYQGAEFGFIGFDEATHFTEHQFKYLMSRLRSVRKGAWPRVRLASNPGGVGHAWVRKYFGIGNLKTPPFEVWKPDPTPEQPKPLSRAFIPAKLDDNTILMEADPGYEARLMELPPMERMALLGGRWDVFSGKAFLEFDRAVHVVKPIQIPDGWKKYRAIDYGRSAPFACLWMAVDWDGEVWVYREHYKAGVDLPEHVQTILGYPDKVAATYADPSMWGKTNYTGESNAEVMNRLGFPMLIPARHDRKHGKARVHEWLRVYQTERGLATKLHIFENCDNLIRTLEDLPVDENDPEDVDTDAEDHAYDALRYFLMMRPAPSNREPEPVELDPMTRWMREMEQLHDQKRRPGFYEEDWG